ncbi:hypothetical protein [Photobacterium sanguinicancri]|uniref:hypothetical protein n=1 Tax=Photobacterium sanguinicancri TaxID=875932 RepID=UPI0021C3A185|nr:hypothetical protein [Photobacterium sanguinicancri]
MTVSALHQTFTSIGLNQLSLSQAEQKELTAFINQHHQFFDNVCQQKADKKPTDLLLGLMTKTQQETVQHFVHNQQAIESMQQVLIDTLGDQQKKFVATDSHRLAIETRLWLLIQGYCGIDFSYANEQAEQSAALLTTSLALPEHAIRSDLLVAYYAGKNQKETKSASQAKSSIIQRIKSFISTNKPY